MRCGGTQYLNEITALYDYNEKLCGPEHIGLPRGLDLLVWLDERENPKSTSRELHNDAVV